MIILVALKRAGGVGIRWKQYSLLGAGVLGDSLGSLRDGVFGQLTGQEEPDSSLDLPGGDGGPLVVVGKTAGLGGDALKEIIDKRVHDAHGLGGDTGVRVDLLQDLVDVDSIGLLPPLLLLLLVSLLDGLGGLARLLSSLSGNLGGHGDAMSCTVKLMGMCRDGGIFMCAGETAGDGVPSARVPHVRGNFYLALIVLFPPWRNVTVMVTPQPE